MNSGLWDSSYLHAGRLTGLILWRSYECNHSCWEFMSIVALIYLEDTVFIWSSLISSFCHLSALSGIMVLKFWGMGRWHRCPMVVGRCRHLFLHQEQLLVSKLREAQGKRFAQYCMKHCAINKYTSVVWIMTFWIPDVISAMSELQNNSAIQENL